MRTAFEQARKRAAIKNFHFHDFRDCVAPNLRRAGVDTTTAMAIVVHKSEKMKMWRRDNTIDEADLKHAARRVEHVFNMDPPRG